MTHHKQNEHRIYELARKWQDGTITAAEMLEFNQWFDSFDDSVANPKATPERREKIYAAIEKMQQSRRSARLVGIKRSVWWAAAAIIILAASGIAIMLGRTGKQEQVVQHPPKVQQHPETVTNNTGLSKRIQLPDGSVVTVSGHSALSWLSPFSDSARELTLSGEALFSVAKDAKRPFTVYAGGIATTAVGTVFTVNTVAPDVVRVALLEGKVVIQPADSSKNYGLGKIILHPGQEFSINKLTNKYLVKNNVPGPEIITNGGQNATKQPVDNNVRLTFNNDPLATVLDQLTRSYKRNIRFNEQDLAGLYFTGAVLKSDSLKTVLTVICNMNQLAFTEEKGFIQIRKSN